MGSPAPPAVLEEAVARVGINPARRRQSPYRPARVTVAVLTHIPHFSGYYRHRFDTMRLCLHSILANTTTAYDLMVFDNGSCDEAVRYLTGLRDAGDLRYLLLSGENIGKIGAFQLLFRAAPGEIVAYSDDDVFFLPGWLEAHLEILESFPEAGMVSGQAIRIRFGDQTSTNQSFASQPEVNAVRGNFIPEAWEREFVVNTGRSWEAYRRQTAAFQDLVFQRNGVEAFATANHFQFVAPRQVILEALPATWGGQLMGQMVELDRAVDEAGYLRLSTRERFIRMMGNVVDEQLVVRAGRSGFELAAAGGPRPRRRKTAGWLKRLPFVTRLARALYDRLYWFIHA